jgi:hypothetical protein
MKSYDFDSLVFDSLWPSNLYESKGSARSLLEQYLKNLQKQLKGSLNSRSWFTQHAFYQLSASENLISRIREERNRVEEANKRIKARIESAGVDDAEEEDLEEEEDIQVDLESYFLIPLINWCLDLGIAYFLRPSISKYFASGKQGPSNFFHNVLNVLVQERILSMRFAGCIENSVKFVEAFILHSQIKYRIPIKLLNFSSSTLFPSSDQFISNFSMDVQQSLFSISRQNTTRFLKTRVDGNCQACLGAIHQLVLQPIYSISMNFDSLNRLDPLLEFYNSDLSTLESVQNRIDPFAICILKHLAASNSEVFVAENNFADLLSDHFHIFISLSTLPIFQAEYLRILKSLSIRNANQYVYQNVIYDLENCLLSDGSRLASTVQNKSTQHLVKHLELGINTKFENPHQINIVESSLTEKNSSVLHFNISKVSADSLRKNMVSTVQYPKVFTVPGNETDTRFAYLEAEDNPTEFSEHFCGSTFSSLLLGCGVNENLVSILCGTDFELSELHSFGLMCLVPKASSFFCLQDVFESDTEVRRSFESSIDSYNFTLKVFDTLIVNPLEESPSNILVQKCENLKNTGETIVTFKISRISSSSSFSVNSSRLRFINGKLFSQFRSSSVVFAFSRMLNQLNPKAVQEFLMVKGETMFYKWIDLIDSSLSNLNLASEVSGHHFRIRSGALKLAYSTFLKIQNILSRNKEMTHLQLLEALDYSGYNAYKYCFDLNLPSFLERFQLQSDYVPLFGELLFRMKSKFFNSPKTKTAFVPEGTRKLRYVIQFQFWKIALVCLKIFFLIQKAIFMWRILVYFQQRRYQFLYLI